MGCKNLLFTNQVASIIGNKTFTASERRTEDSARIMSRQPSYPPPPLPITGIRNLKAPTLGD